VRTTVVAAWSPVEVSTSVNVSVGHLQGGNSGVLEHGCSVGAGGCHECVGQCRWVDACVARGVDGLVGWVSEVGLQGCDVTLPDAELAWPRL